MIESFLFLFTGIIGIVTLTLMLRFYRSNPFCNFFLILALSIVSIRFFIHGSYNFGLQTVIKPDRGLISILFLLIVPSSYLYYKNLTFQINKFNYRDLKHLFFILFLFLINAIDVLRHSFIFYFGRFTNFFLITFFLVFYLSLIFKLLSKNIWFQKTMLLNNEHFKLVKNWTIYFYAIHVLSSLTVLISLYIEIKNGSQLSGKSMAVFLLLFWLFIFFKILISPEILYGLPILNKTLLKFNDSLKENTEIVKPRTDNWILETKGKKSDQDQKLQEKITKNISSYILEVDKLSSEDLIFRNQKASQSTIAEKLGVPTSHIVYLFKYHSKISFSEYRMNSRIQDAIQLIKQNFLSNETLESLAYTTGFSSYNPFFSAFKKITTYSPQEYIKANRI